MEDFNSKNVRELMEDAPERVRGGVAAVIELVDSIRWKKVNFIIPMTPKPSKRPRLGGRRIFVPGAAKNGTFFNNYVLPTLKGLFITTPCKVKLDIYVETPKSFAKGQKILAEMGILRPWTSTGDVDNYEKAVYDMMQPNEKRGHVGIMSNDCLIIEAHTNKYYSITPRYELTISFMGKIPSEITKILRLKGDEFE